MKTTILIICLFAAVTLNGCVAYVVPEYGYGSYYNQPVQYYAPQQYYAPPIYSQYYTPPIDYRKPQGVWYPWGRMGGDDGSRRRSHQR